MVLNLFYPMIRSDSAGDGHYGASRGNRTHNGIDYLCHPGQLVCAPVSGIVSKLGYPYQDDLRWRYVEIRDRNGYRWRLFYCQPAVRDGDAVERGDVVGEADNISERYRTQNMRPHIHLEIIGPDGYINPEELM